LSFSLLSSLSSAFDGMDHGNCHLWHQLPGKQLRRVHRWGRNLIFRTLARFGTTAREPADHLGSRLPLTGYHFSQKGVNTSDLGDA